MLSAFGAAPPELLIDIDTGVNATLARLHGKYSEKAEYIEAVVPSSNTKAPLFYYRAAARVCCLQMQPYLIEGEVEVTSLGPGKLYAGPDSDHLQYVGAVTNVTLQA